MKLMHMILVIFAASLACSVVNGACVPKTYADKNATIDYPPAKDLKKGDTCLITIAEKEAPGFITLMLSEIKLTAGGKLVIYDGKATADNQLFSFTGSSLPKQMGVFFSNSITLSYTVGEIKTESSWMISYNTDVCETQVANTWAVRVEPPKYLPKEKGSFQCTYNIISRLPSEHIPVISQHLALSDKSFLALQNNMNKKQFTGGDAPEDFYGDLTDPIEVTFNVSDASTKPTFSLLVDNVVEMCSGMKETNTTFTFNMTTPADHSVHCSCRGIMTAKSATAKILARVTAVNLVNGADFLTFIDGGSSSFPDHTLTTFTTLPSPGFLVASSGQSMIISLNLGSAAVERHVELSFSSEEAGGRFTGSGTLEAGTTKINADADAEISAYYQLVASPEKVVSIQVLTPLPENATLTFYNGLQTSDKPMTVFTSATTGLDSVIGGSEMLLVLEKFPSTGNFTAIFSSIKSGCDQLLTDANGQLSYSDLTSFKGTEKCTLTISPYPATGDDGTLVLNFDSLSIGEGETVSISAGADDSLVAQFNSTLGQASEVYLPGATLARVLIMNGGDEKNHTTLTGRYSVKSKVCGGSLTAGKGAIQTPNFPNQYPLNAQCSWNVASTDDEAVITNFLYLNFKSIKLAPGHSIEISDLLNSSSEQLACFKGQELPDDIIVPVAAGLKVNFQASPKNADMKNDVDTGSDIDYMVVSCGGNMSAANGTFSSPVPTAGKPSVCVWIIHVADTSAGENQTNIVKFNIALTDKEATAISGSLNVYDGASVRSPIMGFSVTKGVTGQVLSRHNKLVVMYDSSKMSNKDKAGFTINYSTYNCNASQLCDNGMCLHPDWRCNGVDDCGDFTDEKGCVPTPAPIVPTTTPKPSDTGSTSGYVKGGYVALIFFIALILGAVLVLVLPKIVRRIRGRESSYSRMNDNTPVVT